jgi:hypothetical protein
MRVHVCVCVPACVGVRVPVTAAHLCLWTVVRAFGVKIDACSDAVVTSQVSKHAACACAHAVDAASERSPTSSTATATAANTTTPPTSNTATS